MKISKKDKDRFLKRALLAADWFEYTQLGKERTEWDADYGRFLYYYHLPTRQYVPGISWTQSRAIFVLTDAYTATRKKKYLDSAILGGRYLQALQVLDPFNRDVQGAFMYRTPQGPVGHGLDGSQAATALLMLESLTGDSEYLRRAEAFAEFLKRNYTGAPSFRMSARIYPRCEAIEAKSSHWNTVNLAVPVCLWHLYRKTGDRKHLRFVRIAADEMLTSQRSDGAMNMTQDFSVVRSEVLAHKNHHWGHGKGDDRYVLRNDDGMTLLLLAAHQTFKKKKYLDAAVAYAGWIVKNEPIGKKPHCSFPSRVCNVLDIGQATGVCHMDWVMDHLDSHLLSLQNLDRSDRRGYGGFRGEDEHPGPKGGIFGGTTLDYVTTRTTCYAASALFRLSGKGTGSGYCVSGLKE